MRVAVPAADWRWFHMLGTAAGVASYGLQALQATCWRWEA